MAGYYVFVSGNTVKEDAFTQDDFDSITKGKGKLKLFDSISAAESEAELSSAGKYAFICEVSVSDAIKDHDYSSQLLSPGKLDLIQLLNTIEIEHPASAESPSPSATEQEQQQPSNAIRKKTTQSKREALQKRRAQLQKQTIELAQRKAALTDTGSQLFYVVLTDSMLKKDEYFIDDFTALLKRRENKSNVILLKSAEEAEDLAALRLEHTKAQQLIFSIKPTKVGQPMAIMVQSAQGDDRRFVGSKFTLQAELSIEGLKFFEKKAAENKKTLVTGNSSGFVLASSVLQLGQPSEPSLREAALNVASASSTLSSQYDDARKQRGSFNAHNSAQASSPKRQPPSPSKL